VGCWYPINNAVAVIDDLLRATDAKVAEFQILAERYPGRRGIQSARNAIDLADAGAQSPKETWVRLLLIRAGLPRPQTQIPVSDEFGNSTYYLDMGWEDFKVAAEYDGEQHRRDRWQYTWDIRRREALERLGWIVIRVVVGDRPADIVSRVRAALALRQSH
jgi:very-short-patch-repair endonuclease